MIHEFWHVFTKFTVFHKRYLMKQLQLMNFVRLPQSFTPIPHFSYFKLVRTPLNVLLRGFYNYLSLSMHLYTSDGRHAWFHLYGTSQPVRSALKAKKKIQNEKILPTEDSNPQPSDFKSDADWYRLHELAGLVECYPFQWPYYIHILPIQMYTLLLVREWWTACFVW